MGLKNNTKKNIKDLDNVFKIIEEKEEIVETEEEKQERETRKKETNKIKIILLILILSVVFLIAAYVVINVFDSINSNYSNLKASNRENLIITSADETLLENYLQKGKYTIVSFWASWCSHCKNEADVLNKFMIANKNVNFIVVSHDKSIEDLQTYFSKNTSYKWFIIYDSEKIIRKSLDPSASSVPMTFLLDDKGNIIDRINGEATFDQLTALYEKSKLK